MVLAIALFVCRAAAFQAAKPDLAVQARNELFAGRSGSAATLFRKLVDQEPTRGEAYYGLVRALLQDHKAQDAYAAAAQGLAKAPQSSAAQLAAGLGALRRGDLAQAEQYFRAGYKIDPKDPSALTGLAMIYSMVSKFKVARDLRLEAYRQAPEDPALMLVHANSLKGAEHIAALEKILAIYDPESGQARALRVHIARDRAIGDRKLRRVTSPYESARVKLMRLLDGPRRLQGMGLRVRFNDRETATLLLDTGASGISLAPRTAEKAGLEVLGRETGEVKGIGDERSQDALEYLASDVEIGNVKFQNYPVSVFRTAKTQDFDGIIGADVLGQFLVGIDFVKSEITLDPFPKPVASEEPEDANAEIAPGFHRAYRFGDHLMIFTFINPGPGRLFLIDSGAASNLIDEEAAREATSVAGGSPFVVKGIQVNVNKTSLAEHVSLVFAGMRQDNPDLIAFNFDKLSDAEGVGLSGILGMPVLIQLKLTINYQNGTVRMEYKKP